MRCSANGVGHPDRLVAQLRSAGCVFAEQEAKILWEAAADPACLASLVARRVAGEPLEQLVGWVAFAGRRLAVGPGVFVPRARSESLAALTIATVADRSEPVVVEAYCGVAPIAATVARRVPTAQVYATDMDRRALKYAALNLDSRAEIVGGEGLSALPRRLHQMVDVIAAVPPYVPISALAFLPHEAVEHEPRAALVAGADGGDQIRALIGASREWLAPAGAILIEMNTEQVAETISGATDFSAEVFEFEDSRTVVVRLRMR